MQRLMMRTGIGRLAVLVLVVCGARNADAAEGWSTRDWVSQRVTVRLVNGETLTGVITMQTQAEIVLKMAEGAPRPQTGDRDDEATDAVGADYSAAETTTVFLNAARAGDLRRMKELSQVPAKTLDADAGQSWMSAAGHGRGQLPCAITEVDEGDERARVTATCPGDERTPVSLARVRGAWKVDLDPGRAPVESGARAESARHIGLADVEDISFARRTPGDSPTAATAAGTPGTQNPRTEEVSEPASAGADTGP